MTVSEDKLDGLRKLAEKRFQEFVPGSLRGDPSIKVGYSVTVNYGGGSSETWSIKQNGRKA